MAASSCFSRNFVSNLEHVFASSVVVLICQAYFFQKETNQHKYTCDIMWYVKIDDFHKPNVLLLFGTLWLFFQNN